MTHEELLQQRRTLGDVLNELRRIGRIHPDSEAIIIIAETQLMLLDHLLLRSHAERRLFDARPEQPQVPTETE